MRPETSPYLLQHADNPVDWWPWSDAAFEEARRRGVPVLLSVGYSSYHWCQWMSNARSVRGARPARWWCLGLGREAIIC